MANAWELLIEHSTLPESSTAWEHLNAQEGGGSGEIRYVADKPIKFKIKQAQFRFKTNASNLKFKTKTNNIKFMSKEKAIKLKKKEINIVFKYIKVIPEE